MNELRREARHYFVYDGVSSIDFETYIADSTLWDGAEHDDKSVEIPGRNGTLTLDNHRWKNVSAEVSCYMPKDMQTNLDGLRAFLGLHHGYARYEDSMHPDCFRLARFRGPFKVSKTDRVGASFKLAFDCKPQKFLLSGEDTRTISSGAKLANPTGYEALPLIRVYGSGTLTVGSINVSVDTDGTYTDLDCDLQEAYEGDELRNDCVTLTNGDFPVLPAGVTTVTFTGFSRVEITPRWWTI